MGKRGPKRTEFNYDVWKLEYELALMISKMIDEKIQNQDHCCGTECACI